MSSEMSSGHIEGQDCSNSHAGVFDIIYQVGESLA